MIRWLVFVVHQRHALDPQSTRGCNLRVGIVAECQIKAASARPLSERRRAANEISRLACKFSAAMTADHYRHQAGCRCQLNRLRIVTRRHFRLMSALFEFRDQRAKERHVR